jgi:CP family cyanate transporter-like MFS transporter
MAMCAAMQAVGGGLGWSLVPPLMPTMAKELSLSHAMGGLVWGAASLGIALASPLGGAAVDRWGARRVAGGAMLVGALACAARAFATSGPALAGLMFVFGAHIGFTAPAIPKALAGHVPLARLGRANGLALLAYTLVTAIVVAITRTVLLPAFGGWRPIMTAAGVAMALASVAWLSVVRDRTAALPHAGLADVLAMAKHPQLRVVAMVHFLLFGGYLALLGLLPRGLVEAGVAPARAGMAIAAWLLVAAIANALGPVLSDRLGRRRPFIVGGGFVAGAALALLALGPSAAGARPLAFLCVAALGGGCFAPLLLAIPAELDGIGPSRAGAALGFLMLIGQVGGFLLPMLAGGVLQAHGLGAALGILALVHLAVVLPALRLRETGRAAARPGPVATSLEAA